MENAYADFLKELHDKSFTTDEEVADLIHQASGVYPSNKKRLMAGEVNEVYDVELPERNNVIVRVHKSEKPVFLQEKWAIDECRKLDMPVPTILLIKHIPQDDGVVSFCIQEKLPGDTLERGKVPYEQVDKGQAKTLFNKAGSILEKMHSIPVSGFGELDGSGKGDKPNFQEEMTRETEKEEKYMALAKKMGIPEEQMAKAFKTLTERVPKYADMKPTFNHGDFGPKHIMYDGDNVTGILDFGDVLSSAAIYDFARWEYWYGNDERFAWLKEGYSDKSIFADSEELSRLIQLYMNLGIIKWYDKQGYQHGIEEGVKKWRDCLKIFE